MAGTPVRRGQRGRGYSCAYRPGCFPLQLGPGGDHLKVYHLELEVPPAAKFIDLGIKDQIHPAARIEAGFFGIRREPNGIQADASGFQPHF